MQLMKKGRGFTELEIQVVASVCRLGDMTQESLIRWTRSWARIGLLTSELIKLFFILI